LTAHIPVIVLTSLSQNNEDRLLRDGADAFLEKGLLLHGSQPLMSTIGRILRSQEFRRKKSVPPPM
jgi:CheY-like chemotaxis protein